MGDSILTGPVYRPASDASPANGPVSDNVMTGPGYRQASPTEQPLPLPPREDPFEREVQQRLPAAMERVQELQRQSTIGGVELPLSSPSGEFPIISPLLRRGAAAVASAFTGRSYSEELALREAERRAYQATNPTQAIVDQAQGVLGGLAVSPVTRVGQTYQVANTPLSRFGSGYTTAPIQGAAYGAAEGAANIRPGETAEEARKRIEDEALQGGAFGLGARVALPIIGRIANIPGSLSAGAKAAKELAAEVLSQRSSKSPITPEQYDMLRAAGYDVLPAYVRGFSEAASRAGTRDPQALQDLNQELARRAATVNDTARENILRLNASNQFPTLDIAALESAAKTAKFNALDPAYRNAYNLPSAQNLPVDDFILRSPAGRRAVEEASTGLSYRTPNGSFSRTGPFVLNQNTGYLELPPGATVNLEFLDRVKRSLNDQYEELAKTAQQRGQPVPALAGDINVATQRFVDDLKTRVPEYGDVLDTGTRYFTGQDAFRDGLSFLDLVKNSQGKTLSASTMRDYSQQLRLFAKEFSPEERMLFQQGILAAAYQKPADVAKFIANSPARNLDGLRAVMGRDFDQFYNSMLVANASTSMNAIAARGSFAEDSTGRKMAGHLVAGLGNVAAFGGDPALFVLQGMLFSGQRITNRATVARAHEILSMASDPARVPDMLKLINENPNYRAILIRMQPFITRMAAGNMEASETPDIVETAGTIVRNAPGEVARMGRSVSEALEPIQRAPQRFAGGRVGRASGGRLVRTDHAARAASLIRAAEAAKKAHNRTTEDILEQPDEAVAKALSIANKAI